MIWIEKKLQVMAYLVSLDGFHMERRRLLNLIYLADRKAYTQRAIPVAGGRVFAMDSGPANYDIYDLMLNHAEYQKYFENEGYLIVLKQEPDYMDLSEYEMTLLKETHDMFHNKDCWELAVETQKFQEWKDAWNLEDVEDPQWIPLEKLLASIGYDEKYIPRVISEIESHERMCHICNPEDCKGDSI